MFFTVGVFYVDILSVNSSFKAKNDSKRQLLATTNTTSLDLQGICSAHLGKKLGEKFYCFNC